MGVHCVVEKKKLHLSRDPNPNENLTRTYSGYFDSPQFSQGHPPDFYIKPLQGVKETQSFQPNPMNKCHMSYFTEYCAKEAKYYCMSIASLYLYLVRFPLCTKHLGMLFRTTFVLLLWSAIQPRSWISINEVNNRNQKLPISRANSQVSIIQIPSRHHSLFWQRSWVTNPYNWRKSYLMTIYISCGEERLIDVTPLIF